MPEVNDNVQGHTESQLVNETPAQEVQETKPAKKKPTKTKTVNAKQEKSAKESKPTSKKDKTMKTATKNTKDAKKTTKKAAPKAAKTKASQPKKDRAEIIRYDDVQAMILKYLAKCTKPVKRNQISEATGIKWGINWATGGDPDNSLVKQGLIKRESAEYHGMGAGYAYTITAKGKAKAGK